MAGFIAKSRADESKVEDAVIAGDAFDLAERLLLQEQAALRQQLQRNEAARHALFTGRIAAASASGCRYIAGHSAA